MVSGLDVVLLGMVLSVAGIVLSVLRLYTGEPRYTRIARVVSLGLLVLVSSMMLFMYHLFITADVSYEYVWTFTSSDTPMKYRVSGTIAGMVGSLMFWVWMIVIPWSIEELRALRRPVDPAVMGWTRIGVMATVTVFMYVLFLHDPFAATPPELLARWPEGNGLNALLQTDMMAIHPPVVFLAYGFLVVPFGASVAYLVTGHRDWLKLSFLWSRAGWLFLTLGIAIGAIWAYTVLGWGGYWGWDPVETSSLLPWLLLSGFLHAQLMNRRKADYPVLAPVMGVMSFVLIVFATFATRAAGLWVSVHTFGPADSSKPAWDRFTDMLFENETVRVYFALMVALTIMAAVLALYQRRRSETKEEERYYSLDELVDDDMLMFFTITLFTVTTAVTMLILVGGVNGLSADNFNTPVGVLSLVGMLTLLLCLVWRDLGRKRVLQLAGVAVLVALVGAIMFHDNLAVAVSVPILLVGLVGTVYKVARSFDMRRAMPSLVPVGAHLIHLSVVLILIGYVGSTFLQDETVLELTVDGGAKEFGGYSFKSTDFDTDLSTFAHADVEVWRGGGLVGKARPGLVVINDQVRSEIKVVKALGEDVYLVYYNSSETGSTTSVNVGVTLLPLMNVLWAGMALMWIGIIVRMLAEPLSKRRARRRTAPLEALEEELREDTEKDVEEGTEEEVEEVADEPVSEGDRDDSYYEDLLEEELKRM